MRETLVGGGDSMACLVLLYELISKDVKVHAGDTFLQAELIARNMGSVVKSQCTLRSH